MRFRMRCVVLSATVTFVLLASVSVSQAAEWKKHVLIEGGRYQTAIAADFTGDGKPDVMTTTMVKGAKNRIVLFAGPEWKEVTIGGSPEYSFIHSEAFDVDGDGDTDYIGARYQPGLIMWFEQPDNPLTDPWTARLVDDKVNGIHGVIRGDIDGDGKPDLLATSAQPKEPFPNSLAWLKVPKSPKTAERWERYIFAKNDAPGLTHYIGVGDVNGDGRADAATGAKGGPTAEPGTGNYFAWWEAGTDPKQPWKKHRIANDQPGATNIHPADVNGDGKTDFIASRGHGKGVVWFEAPNWKQHQIHPTIKEPHCLVAIDMDNDGDIDAATCAFGDKLCVWFENDGKGNFKTHEVGRNQEAYDIRAHDLDSDGDLDLLVGGRGSNNVVWFENPEKPAK